MMDLSLYEFLKPQKKKEDIFSMIFGVNTVYMRYELFLKSNYSILQLKKNLRVV